MDANLSEAMKWFRQGEKDLLSSRNSSGTLDYEWACFQAQQSAEKTLKAGIVCKRVPEDSDTFGLRSTGGNREI